PSGRGRRWGGSVSATPPWAVCRTCALTLATLGPAAGRTVPRSIDHGPGTRERAGVQPPGVVTGRVRCDGLGGADAEERAGVSTSGSEEPGRTDPGGSNGRAPDGPGTPRKNMADEVGSTGWPPSPAGAPPPGRPARTRPGGGSRWARARGRRGPPRR